MLVCTFFMDGGSYLVVVASTGYGCGRYLCGCGLYFMMVLHLLYFVRGS